MIQRKVNLKTCVCEKLQFGLGLNILWLIFFIFYYDSEI